MEKKKKSNETAKTTFSPWKSRPDGEPRKRVLHFNVKESVAEMLIEMSARRCRSMNAIVESLIIAEYGKQATGDK